jgi:hypothetical protein
MQVTEGLENVLAAAKAQLAGRALVLGGRPPRKETQGPGNRGYLRLRRSGEPGNVTPEASEQAGGDPG